MMPTPLTSRPARTILCSLLLAGAALMLGAPAARAQLIFTVDTFTTDELTITFNPSALSGSQFINDFELNIADADNLSNASWINAEVTGIGTGSFVLGAVTINHHQTYSTGSGDLIGFWNTGYESIADGSSIVAPYTVSFIQAGAFNPAAVNNLGLFWGSTVNFPIQQSTVSVAAIPEPSTYAMLFGLFSLLGVIHARRRKALAS